MDPYGLGDCLRMSIGTDEEMAFVKEAFRGSCNLLRSLGKKGSASCQLTTLFTCFGNWDRPYRCVDYSRCETPSVTRKLHSL